MTAPSEIPTGAPSSPPAQLSIDYEAKRDTVMIAPRGEIDLATAGHLRGELKRAIDAGPARIVIDLRGVEFLDSTGLHTLIETHAQAQHDNWELTIIPGPRAVQRIFEITGSTHRLPFATPNGRAVTL